MVMMSAERIEKVWQREEVTVWCLWEDAGFGCSCVGRGASYQLSSLKGFAFIH